MGLRWTILAGAGLLALALVARAQDTLPLRHAHGLGYSADGARIMIPGHQGIMVYGGKRWSIAPGPARDYMGFAVTRRFIFTSGHHAPGGASGLSLGLLRSGDGGRSWAASGSTAKPTSTWWRRDTRATRSTSTVPCRIRTCLGPGCIGCSIGRR